MEDKIIKWKINRRLLAKETWIKYSSLANKLNKNLPDTFTKSELLKLKDILLKLSNDFKELNDFPL